MRNITTNGIATKHMLVVTFILLLFIGILVYSWSFLATEHSVCHQLNTLPQNTLAYVDPAKQFQMSPQEQKQLSDHFLAKYFSPWKINLTSEQLVAIQGDFKQKLKNFKEHPGVGPNTHRYNAAWLMNLETNMDLEHFPNSNQNAITIHDSNMRLLPTTDPSFSDLTSLSRGYPFDNLQQTFIPAGTPIRILQTSKDNSWYLVQACSYSGWVNDDDIAFVSKKFEREWQTGSFAVSTQDNIPIFDEKRRITTKTRIGVLYPVSKETQKDFTILTPVKNENEAITKSVAVSKAFLTSFPVPLSTANIASIANNLMGKPYGWGGIYGYRDCSSTLKDLLATVGIWLPRHSGDQVQGGKTYSFKGLSNKQKEKLIIQHGVPFLTLIHLPGHVILYVGSKNGHPIVFQNMWGLHIYKLFGHKDRIVIGKTVITPINFGSNFINNSLNFLTAVDRMSTLYFTNP
jgi:cell wall-associated NlpC family hydrolase